VVQRDLRERGMLTQDAKPLLTAGDNSERNGIDENPMTNATFKDGKLHGSFETYHDNGILKERGTYQDDFLNGIYETWHDNGTLKERGNFSGGKRHGLSKWYHESGILKERGCWKDGVLVSETCFTETGEEKSCG